MSFFGRFTKARSPVVDISMKAPKNISTLDTSIPVTVFIRSNSATMVDRLLLRLRGDLQNRVEAPSEPIYLILGEVAVDEPIQLHSEKSSETQISLPLNFDSLNDYEIPAENLTKASKEMQATLNTTKKGSYAYAIEAIIQLKNRQEPLVKRVSIELLNATQVNSGII